MADPRRPSRYATCSAGDPRRWCCGLRSPRDLARIGEMGVRSDFGRSEARGVKIDLRARASCVARWPFHFEIIRPNFFITLAHFVGGTFVPPSFVCLIGEWAKSPTCSYTRSSGLARGWLWCPRGYVATLAGWGARGGFCEAACCSQAAFALASVGRRPSDRHLRRRPDLLHGLKEASKKSALASGLNAE
jgi:hypothetical protein